MITEQGWKTINEFCGDVNLRLLRGERLSSDIGQLLLFVGWLQGDLQDAREEIDRLKSENTWRGNNVP